MPHGVNADNTAACHTDRAVQLPVVLSKLAAKCTLPVCMCVSCFVLCEQAASCVSAETPSGIADTSWHMVPVIAIRWWCMLSCALDFIFLHAPVGNVARSHIECASIADPSALPRPISHHRCSCASMALRCLLRQYQGLRLSPQHIRCFSSAPSIYDRM